MQKDVEGRGLGWNGLEVDIIESEIRTVMS